ncbi:MAG: hypothetical protein RR589_10960 [Hafnia sp.]|uniref:hypothetical protein n=1 Tax=Hafnia sp. TaxID=1873498 RepID=UPI002FC75E7D
MTSREQFEAIYMKREPEASMAFNENVGRYKYAFIQSQYEFFLEAWQASREAVEVELPELFEDDRHAVTDAIRAAGIKVKGE